MWTKHVACIALAATMPALSACSSSRKTRVVDQPRVLDDAQYDRLHAVAQPQSARAFEPPRPVPVPAPQPPDASCRNDGVQLFRARYIYHWATGGMQARMEFEIINNTTERLSIQCQAEWITPFGREWTGPVGGMLNSGERATYATSGYTSRDQYMTQVGRYQASKFPNRCPLWKYVDLRSQ